MNKRIKRMGWALRAWANPGFWLRTAPSSRELTDFVHESLDKGCKPEAISEYWMRINGVELWRENWPYAYGGTRLHLTQHARLPSCGAALRLRKAEIAEYPFIAVKSPSAEARIRQLIAEAKGETK